MTEDEAIRQTAKLTHKENSQMVKKVYYKPDTSIAEELFTKGDSCPEGASAMTTFAVKYLSVKKKTLIEAVAQSTHKKNPKR